jgi:peptidoglycan/xylan/chitin deacetylase (PgdA/CDA1 family)
MRGSIARHPIRRLGQLIGVRPANIRRKGGVASFTFDDFPKSALAEGGGILEKHGLRGTYYVALGLMDTDGKLGPIAGSDDVRAAHARGHELACHTFSHLDCSRAATPQIIDEIDRNAEAFAALVDDFAPTNFAYPFGAVCRSAKRALAPRFATCRGIFGGINAGRVDLADLLATRLYDCSFDERHLRKLIDRNRAVGGWLIFYTHDVSATPSPFGCTPRQLEGIVAYAAARSAVLPVRDVVAGLGSRV